MESATDVGLTLDPDLAAMLVDDLLADVKTQACPGWLTGELIPKLAEFLEDPSVVFGRYATPCVGD